MDVKLSVDARLASGVGLYIETNGISFVHLTSARETQVSELSTGDITIQTDDVSVFLSLGQAAAIGEVAAAEMARLEAERPAQSEAKS